MSLSSVNNTLAMSLARTATARGASSILRRNWEALRRGHEHFTLQQLQSRAQPGQLSYDPCLHEPLLRNGYTLAQLLHKKVASVSLFRDKRTQQVSVEYQHDADGNIPRCTPYLHDTVEVWRGQAQSPMDSIAGWWLWVRLSEATKKKKVTDLVPVFLNPANDEGTYTGVYFPYLTLQTLHKTPDRSPSHLRFAATSGHTYHYTWSYPDGTKGTGVMYQTPTGLNLVRGNDYYAVDGRGLDWSSNSWPVLTGATIQFIVEGNVLSVAGDVVISGGDIQTVRVELSAANTALLVGSSYNFNIVATLADGHMVTLVDRSLLIVSA